MSILKNSTVVAAGILISNLLAYGFHFIAGRMLGPEDYGVFGALMALFILIALPAGALSFAITKFVARFISGNQLGEINFLRKKIQKDVIFFSAIILLVIVGCSKLIATFLKMSSIIPIIVVGITLSFSLLLPVNRGILQGMKKFQAISLNLIIEAFSRVVLLLVLMSIGGGVNGAIVAYGLAYLVAFLAIFPAIKETRTANTAVEKIEIKPVYKFIFQVLAINIILQCILNIPSLLIKHFYSSEFTGSWTAALNLARLSLFIISSISLVMFPEISKEKNIDAQKKIFYKSMALAVMSTMFMATVFYFIPGFLIQNLYGKSYLAAVPILKIMGFMMILFGILQLRLDYYLAKMK